MPGAASPGCTRTSPGDLRKTFCIYDAPTPEAIRETARDNNLPIDSITSVSVLDPYFYRG